MKVKDFIQQLKQTDPEREIIMYSDVEGNDYSAFWFFQEDDLLVGEESNPNLESDINPVGIEDGFSKEYKTGDVIKTIFLIRNHDSLRMY